MTRNPGRIGFAAALAAGALLAAPSADAADITLRFSGAHPPVLVYGKAAKQQLFPNLKKRAGELGHNLRIIEAWAGSAVPAREQAQGVSNGVVDLATVIIPFEQAAVPLFNYAYTVPFGPGDMHVATRVGQRLLKEVPELQASLDRFEITGLSNSTAENYGILTKFPIDTLSAIKGRPIGVAGSNAPWIEKLGGVGVNAVFQQVYQNMQTGVMEGLVTFLSPIKVFKLNDQAKYFYRTDFGAPTALLLSVNDETLAGLPADFAQVLQEEADAYAVVQAELGTANDEGAEAALTKADPDFKVVTLSDELRREWAELLKDEPNDAAQRVNSKGLPGTKVWRAYLQLLEEEGYKTPVKYVIN